MMLSIYSTPNEDTIDTVICMADVLKSSTVTVQWGGYGLDRKVDVIFDITHTEI